MLVGYGYEGIRMVSEDGENWSEPVTWKESFPLCAGAYGNGRFVTIAGSGYRGYALVLTSEDGQNWSEPIKVDDKPPPKPYGVQFGGGKFVMFGGGAGGPKKTTAVTSSEDGQNWTKVKEHAGGTLMNACYGNGQFVAVGVLGRVAVSQDGVDWKDAPDRRPVDTFIGIAAGDDGFVGGGLHGMRMFSRDGLHWDDRQVGEEGEHLNSVLWVGDRYVAVGLGATYFSPDGRTWQRRENQNAPLRCVYHNGRFVGSAWRGRILVSDDAIDWREVHRAPHHVEGFIVAEA